ncbi:MAG: hypothetical protein IPK10_03445 [Bacteroidetes bacterium]|nr:hypothetical protein [Bacteroidota bacterium]
MERKISPDAKHAGLILNFSYGLHTRWNVLLKAPLIHNEVKPYNDPGGLTKGKKITKQGDLEVGLKFSLPSSSEWNSCFTAWQSLGTAERDDSLLLHTGYADFNSRLYYELHYAKSEKWTIGSTLGFNKRNKDNSDEVHAGLITSIQLAKRLFIDGRFDLMYSLENRSKKPIYYELGLYHNNARLLSASGTFRYQRENGMNIIAGYQLPIRGQYIFNAPLINVGFTLKFNTANKVESTDTSSN